MLNQLVLVGRMIENPEVTELENGGKASIIKLACQRAYKNENGDYDTDIIPIKLFHGIADNVKEYCHKGDIIGVKGRVLVTNDAIEVIAEKVTFLSNKTGE